MATPIDANSLSGKLVAMAGNLAEGIMKQRGLTHVPAEDPGFQLYVEDGADGAALRDALLPVFANRASWWIGGLGDALTLQQTNNLVPEKDLDRFVDEAFEIERAARAAIRKES